MLFIFHVFFILIYFVFSTFYILLIYYSSVYFKNCRPVLERSKLTSLFDGILDGTDLESQHIEGKPKPDMFLEYVPS